jgi:hypothetical protein
MNGFTCIKRRGTKWLLYDTDEMKILRLDFVAQQQETDLSIWSTREDSKA